MKQHHPGKAGKKTVRKERKVREILGVSATKKLEIVLLRFTIAVFHTVANNQLTLGERPQLIKKIREGKIQLQSPRVKQQLKGGGSREAGRREGYRSDGRKGSWCLDDAPDSKR